MTNNEPQQIELRSTSEEDRTYIGRLNFLTDVMGDEAAEVSENFERDYETYVDHWKSENGGFIAWCDFIPAGGAWLIWGDDEKRGYGFVSSDIPEVAIAVEKRFRGTGIGTQLLNACIELARQLGAPGISLCVDVRNPRAHQLYNRVGFQDIRFDEDKQLHVLELRFGEVEEG